MRNLSAYPVTKEEKERYLRARLAEWEATPTEQIRFGDMTGAILWELIKDLSKSSGRSLHAGELTPEVKKALDEAPLTELSEKFLGVEKQRVATRYSKLALSLETDLTDAQYQAALAAVSAVPGVYISHYILTDGKGAAHLKVMDVGRDGRVQAVQG